MNEEMREEHPRDARGMRWAESFAADVRYAFRYFARNKVTVALIVAVLALGIGGNTVIFSMIRGTFFRPAPTLKEDDSQVQIYSFLRETRTSNWRERDFSIAELEELAARTETFRDVVGWTHHEVVLDAGDSTGARGVAAEFVTSNYFSFLGVPVSGPGWTNTAGADMAAVMSFQAAELLYEDPASAVGRTVMVNQVPVRVVGVTPPRFQGALRDHGNPALWMPLGARADVAHIRPNWFESPSLGILARMAPGVDRERAQADAQLIVARAIPDSVTRLGGSRRAEVLAMTAPPPNDAFEMVLIIVVMGLIGLLVLLVACTNVSSLMVAAAVARRHEITVRMSLGASRARLLRQLLSETTLLALAGSAIGLLLAWWALAWATRTEVDGASIMPDVTTVAFALAVALGTGVLFGLSPALHAMRGGLANALRDSGGAGATSRSRLQRIFVVAQIGLSQPLLVLVGVILSAAIADYRPLPETLSQRIAVVGLRPLSRTGVPGARREAVDSLMPRIAQHPEVVGVVPDAAAFLVRTFMTPGDNAGADSARARITVEGTAPGYFALLNVPIVLGRDLTWADTASKDYPVVIGSDLAREIWADANPIGRMLISPSQDPRDSITLVVAGVYDATQNTTRGGEVRRVYTAAGKRWRRDAILVRTRGVAEPFLPELRRVIRSEAPGLPISSLTTQALKDDAEQVNTLKLTAAIASGGALALLLASLGLYGVVALAVQQRRREIGIRIAVGATPGRVVRMFLASGVRIGALALAIGLPISIVALRFGLRQEVIIAPTVSPALIGGSIAVLLLGVAALAAWIPARRAARVDPATTLRTE